MEQHRTIQFEGHTIHYRDEGREHPNVLVLLHGYLQSLDVWSSYTLSYMRHMRVITIDLPGHGYSDNIGEVNTMEMMAKCVKAVLNAAGVEQCVMIGHSLGGYVALAFAEADPYALRGLGLLHSHALADTVEQRQRRLATCEEIRVNRAQFILDFIPSLFNKDCNADIKQEIKDLADQSLEIGDYGAIAAQKGMMQRKSRIHILQQLQIPCLFIFGKKDRRLPIELGVTQAMEAQYAEIMILENAAHMAHIEEREYVKIRLKNFVDTCYA